MDFELVISGMCVIAMKSSEARPARPESVDILCPQAHHHRTRLTYDFTRVQAAVTHDLVIDPDGKRFASLPLKADTLKFAFSSSPHREFVVRWGAEDASTPPPEQWMNWVPRLEELGFPPLRLTDGTRPVGTAARITLPYGELAARNVVRERKRGGFALWEFPATATNKQPAIQKSLANEIVYRAIGVGTLIVSDERENTVLTAGSEDDRSIFRMCISTDLSQLTPDTPMETVALTHLQHLEELAGRNGRFQAPTLSAGQRTGGGPICTQVVTVYSDPKE